MPGRDVPRAEQMQQLMQDNLLDLRVLDQSADPYLARGRVGAADGLLDAAALDVAPHPTDAGRVSLEPARTYQTRLRADDRGVQGGGVDARTASQPDGQHEREPARQLREPEGAFNFCERRA